MSTSRTSNRFLDSTRSRLNARRRGSADDNEDPVIRSTNSPPSPPTRPLRSNQRRDRSSSYSSGSEQKDSRLAIPAQVRVPALNHEHTARKKRSINSVRFSPQHSTSDPASVISDLSSSAMEPERAPLSDSKTAVPVLIDKNPIPNIIFFGETGAGKSSVINMIADSELAPVSSNAAGCTVGSQCYLVSLGNGLQAKLWDTAGLSEGGSGVIPTRQAVQNLLDLVSTLTDGASLIVYCIRGTMPFRNVLKSHFDMLWATICDKRVPIVAVITGLEHRRPMESWWRENLENLEKSSMSFAGHACVTATRGKAIKDGEGFLYDREFEASQAMARRLVSEHSLKAPAHWIKDKAAWITEMTDRLTDYYHPPEALKLKSADIEESKDIELDRSLGDFICVFLFVCLVVGIILVAKMYAHGT